MLEAEKNNCHAGFRVRSVHEFALKMVLTRVFLLFRSHEFIAVLW